MPSIVPFRRGTPQEDRRPDAGFSLVEVMVAFAIMGFAILGAVMILQVANQSDQTNTMMRYAESQAQGIIENFVAGNPGMPSFPGYTGYPGSLPITPGTSAIPQGTSYTNAVQGGYQTTVGGSANALYVQWSSSLDPAVSGQNVTTQRLDVIVGWGREAACTQSSPQKCGRVLRMTSYY